MKLTLTLCFFSFIAAVIPLRSGDTDGPWAASGDEDAFLSAHGSELRSHHGSGDPVQLRGVNLGGWLEWQEWMCPIDASKTLRDDNPGHNGYDFEVRRLLTSRFGAATAEELIGVYEDAWITERDLDNIKALGMNAVRLTLAYDTFLNEDGSWRDDAFTRIDWLVQKAWARGIYTIIDFHAFLPGSANQDGSAGAFWSSTEQQNETVEIWKKVAEHFRGAAPVAMYDLLNEPVNSAPKGKPEPKAATVCALYDRIFHAIRSVDPDHVIAMEGLWDWKSLRDPRQAGYSNFVCSLHWYHWDAKGSVQLNAGTDTDLRGAAKLKETWDVPLLVGEFNLFGERQAWAYAIEAYDKAGVSWTAWTYKNKAEGDNSWGVYTVLPGNEPQVPDLTKDSADTIKVKWREWSTSKGHFGLNPMLGPVLKAKAATP